jgi:hypothetical protein
MRAGPRPRDGIQQCGPSSLLVLAEPERMEDACEVRARPHCRSARTRYPCPARGAVNRASHAAQMSRDGGPLVCSASLA